MSIDFKKILAAALFLTASISAAETVPTAINFQKTVLPILKDSCFACHLPGGDKPYASKDFSIAKKMNKIVGDGLDALTMGDKFPFEDEDPAAKQLKYLDKQLSKHRMPPEVQAELGLGLPLSDKNRQLLLDWVAQQKKLVR